MRIVPCPFFACCDCTLQWDLMFSTEFDVLTLGDDGQPMVHRKNLQDFISFFFSTGAFGPAHAEVIPPPLYLGLIS